MRLNEPSCSLDADGSVSVHICHSRIREVQVLQQQLLAQLEADPDLRPEQILVLVPEIADYTDAIQSVFATGTRLRADAEPVKIPFCIADQKSTGDANCWRFLTTVVDVVKGRQRFSEVMALLDFDPVCQRVGLEHDRIRDPRLLQRVGVRWGIDAADRRVRACRIAHYSWDYGCDKSMTADLQEALSDRAAQVTTQLLEGLGSLTQFLRPIFELAARSTERKCFRDWSGDLLSVLRQVLGESRESGEWMRLLAVSIGELQQHATDVEISLETFCSMVAEGDHAEAGPSGLLRRGVTFCRLQPARHIPAKVLCILGLDEGSYPRQEKSLEFDLIELQRRAAKDLRGGALRYQEIHYLGDAQLRDADRQLFLDCLLNARQRLFQLCLDKARKTAVSCRRPCCSVN